MSAAPAPIDPYRAPSAPSLDEGPRRHSILGLISILICLGVWLIEGGALTWVIATLEGEEQAGEAMAGAMLLGFCFLGGLLMNVVGTVVGFVGLFGSGSKRALAVIGLAANLVTAMMVVGLLLVGLTLG